VLYFKKPCTNACDSTICPSGCNADGVCVPEGCTPCKNGTGTCAPNGTCNSNCESTCPSTDSDGKATGMVWDGNFSMCTVKSDWTEILCPVKCLLNEDGDDDALCPFGYWAHGTTYDPRVSSGTGVCNTQADMFDKANLYNQCYNKRKWVPSSPNRSNCCKPGSTSCPD